MKKCKQPHMSPKTVAAYQASDFPVDGKTQEVVE